MALTLPRIFGFSLFVAATLAVSACSSPHTATLPAVSTAQRQGPHVMSTIAPPTGGGCTFGSDGSIACSSNCTGYYDANGHPVVDCTDDGSGSLFGPSGGWYGSIYDWGNQYNGGFSPNPTTNQMTAAQRIWNAAMKFKINHSTQYSTLNLRGASATNECVAAIQQILANAGLSLIGGGTLWLPTFEQDLSTSGYVEVTQDQAQAGDFVIQGNDIHIGICENNGCTMMISNSSTPESFTWETPPSQFAASYTPAVPNRFWHHSP